MDDIRDDGAINASVMENIADLCTELERMTAALQVAAETEQVTEFCQLVQQRDESVKRVLACCNGLNAAEREMLAASIERILASDKLTLASAQYQLRATRAQLLQLRRGFTALESYRAPLRFR
jgi:hypothetical protein